MVGRSQSGWLSVALRKESVDRNREQFKYVVQCRKSLSARRAWIEMLASRLADMSAAVALRKESVDRNMLFLLSPVAVGSSLSARRAWIEITPEVSDMESLASLSARRAWIEIIGLSYDGLIASVALRKESVDRNYIIKITGTARAASLSARRAWIEICGGAFAKRLALSSLSARRAWIEIKTRSQPSKPRACRSPQGERG